MIAVGLPSIREDLSIGYTEIAWLASSYLIALAVMHAVGGRMGDQLGRSLVYRSGLVAFLAASLLAAVAPNYALLMIFRTSQAIAGAIIVPNGLAMLRESVPASHLGRAMGIFSATASLAAALGPLLGALVMAMGPWRLLFLVNVPVIAIALGTHVLLRYADHLRRSAFRLDLPGVLLFAAVLASLTLFIGSTGSAEGRLMMIYGVAALLLVAVFVRSQIGSSAPIADWKLFQIRSFSGASVYVLLNTLILYTILLTVPFFTEELQGHASVYGGVVLGVHAGGKAFGAPVGGRLSDTFGRRLPILASSLVLVLACGMLAGSITRESSFLMLAAPLVVIGLGLGMGFGAASAAAIEAAPRELAGAAAGTYSMMRWVGGVAGIALLGTILDTGAVAPPLYVFRWVFVVLTLASGLACLFSMMVHKSVSVQDSLVPERVALPGSR